MALDRCRIYGRILAIFLNTKSNSNFNVISKNILKKYGIYYIINHCEKGFEFQSPSKAIFTNHSLKS